MTSLLSTISPDLYGIVYLDFQKAFNKVPHNTLMFRVKQLGIAGNVDNWIENWLRYRKQSCYQWICLGSGTSH